MTTLHEAAQQALDQARVTGREVFKDSCNHTQDAIEWFYAEVSESLRSALAQQGEQQLVAYSYELATTVCDGVYGGWESKLTKGKPHVPPGSFRNLHALTYAGAAPAPQAQQELVAYLNPDLEFMAEEAECVSKCLDDRGVPKAEDGKSLSLWGRVVQYKDGGWKDAEAHLRCPRCGNDRKVKITTGHVSTFRQPAPHPDARTVVQQMVDALSSCVGDSLLGGQQRKAAIAAGQKLLKGLK